MTLGKCFSLVVVFFLVVIIFIIKTQYAVLGQYLFERPISGQINISNYYSEKKVEINNQSILLEGEEIQYEATGKEYKHYDIEFWNEYGESILKVSNFSISRVKFYSNNDNIATGGISSAYTFEVEKIEEVINDNASQSKLLIAVVLVKIRYELLYKQLLLLICVLFPFMCMGILLYFKPIRVERFLFQRLFKLNQLSENGIKRLGIVVFLISLILPFVLLYV